MARLFLHILHFLHDSQPGRVGSATFHLAAHLRYLPLTHAEVSSGAAGVEHRRHEVGPVVASGKQSGVGGKKSRAAVARIHHEHTEHLAASVLLPQHSALIHMTLHLTCRRHTHGMRCVAEGEGELPGTLKMSVKRMQARVFGRII